MGVMHGALAQGVSCFLFDVGSVSITYVVVLPVTMPNPGVAYHGTAVQCPFVIILVGWGIRGLVACGLHLCTAGGVLQPLKFPTLVVRGSSKILLHHRHS